MGRFSNDMISDSFLCQFFEILKKDPHSDLFEKKIKFYQNIIHTWYCFNCQTEINFSEYTTPHSFIREVVNRILFGALVVSPPTDRPYREYGLESLYDDIKKNLPIVLTFLKENPPLRNEYYSRLFIANMWVFYAANAAGLNLFDSRKTYEDIIRFCQNATLLQEYRREEQKTELYALYQALKKYLDVIIVDLYTLGLFLRNYTFLSQEERFFILDKVDWFDWRENNAAQLAILMDPNGLRLKPDEKRYISDKLQHLPPPIVKTIILGDPPTTRPTHSTQTSTASGSGTTPAPIAPQVATTSVPSASTTAASGSGTTPEPITQPVATTSAQNSPTTAASGSGTTPEPITQPVATTSAQSASIRFASWFEKAKMNTPPDLLVRRAFQQSDQFQDTSAGEDCFTWVIDAIQEYLLTKNQLVFEPSHGLLTSDWEIVVIAMRLAWQQNPGQIFSYLSGFLRFVRKQTSPLLFLNKEEFEPLLFDPVRGLHTLSFSLRDYVMSLKTLRPSQEFNYIIHAIHAVSGQPVSSRANTNTQNSSNLYTFRSKIIRAMREGFAIQGEEIMIWPWDEEGAYHFIVYQDKKELRLLVNILHSPVPVSDIASIKRCVMSFHPQTPKSMIEKGLITPAKAYEIKNVCNKIRPVIYQTLQDFCVSASPSIPIAGKNLSQKPEEECSSSLVEDASSSTEPLVTLLDKQADAVQEVASPRPVTPIATPMTPTHEDPSAELKVTHTFSEGVEEFLHILETLSSEQKKNALIALFCSKTQDIFFESNTGSINIPQTFFESLKNDERFTHFCHNFISETFTQWSDYHEFILTLAVSSEENVFQYFPPTQALLENLLRGDLPADPDKRFLLHKLPITKFILFLNKIREILVFDEDESWLEEFYQYFFNIIFSNLNDGEKASHLIMNFFNPAYPDLLPQFDGYWAWDVDEGNNGVWTYLINAHPTTCAIVIQKTFELSETKPSLLDTLLKAINMAALSFLFSRDPDYSAVFTCLLKNACQNDSLFETIENFMRDWWPQIILNRDLVRSIQNILPEFSNTFIDCLARIFPTQGTGLMLLQRYNPDTWYSLLEKAEPTKEPQKPYFGWLKLQLGMGEADISKPSGAWPATAAPPLPSQRAPYPPGAIFAAPPGGQIFPPNNPMMGAPPGYVDQRMLSQVGGLYYPPTQAGGPRAFGQLSIPRAPSAGGSQTHKPT